jgi:hypothetical protein
MSRVRFWTAWRSIARIATRALSLMWAGSSTVAEGLLIACAFLRVPRGYGTSSSSAQSTVMLIWISELVTPSRDMVTAFPLTISVATPREIS